ncbi:MAG: nucleoside triphosphate pyrophosphohydrolase [Clostridia bacterium]|nr:nucleoside triphosphate pyrophosphohydrolase [Clostridia bacterium]MBQ7043965.1 nucleoside triphosphate pyrophosphohydrolase [Clostridia bacterium]
MINNFVFKEKYDIHDLVEIIKDLRSEGGCPWDMVQTHESIRKDLIEETYETIEAINKADPDMLREELGDVLMQVVFHAQIETEKGVFTFDDVADEICKKMIERHPHVFGEVSVEGVDDVLTNWDAIKRRTKGQKSTSEAIDSVPRELPALMRANKIQSKAAKAGFDWTEVGGALERLSEEIDELKEAIASGKADEISDELGDVLFSAVNVSRFVKVDPEEALTKSTDKFVGRFKQVEAKANERGIDMKSAPLEILDSLWDEAKKGI